jgi:hypothetical protein
VYLDHVIRGTSLTRGGRKGGGGYEHAQQRNGAERQHSGHQFLLAANTDRSFCGRPYNMDGRTAPTSAAARISRLPRVRLHVRNRALMPLAGVPIF